MAERKKPRYAREEAEKKSRWGQGRGQDHVTPLSQSESGIIWKKPRWGRWVLIGKQFQPQSWPLLGVIHYYSFSNSKISKMDHKSLTSCFQYCLRACEEYVLSENSPLVSDMGLLRCPSTMVISGRAGVEVTGWWYFCAVPTPFVTPWKSQTTYWTCC